MGYSQRSNTERAPACCHTESRLCSSRAVCPGGDYYQPPLLSLILHLPFLTSSLTSGTLSSVYGRAALPGEDEGVPTERCGAILFWWFPLHCHWQWCRGLQGNRISNYLLDCGTSVHKGATVTLEAKHSCGIREGFNPSTSFQRETECQTYLGAVRGMWRKPL